MLPGLSFSNRFSRAVKYKIRSLVIETIAVIPANLNIHRHSVDLGVAGRENCHELGRLAGVPGDVAVPAAFVAAVLTGLMVLFQGWEQSLGKLRSPQFFWFGSWKTRRPARASQSCELPLTTVMVNCRSS